VLLRVHFRVVDLLEHESDRDRHGAGAEPGGAKINPTEAALEAPKPSCEAAGVLYVLLAFLQVKSHRLQALPRPRFRVELLL